MVSDTIKELIEKSKDGLTLTALYKLYKQKIGFYPFSNFVKTLLDIENISATFINGEYVWSINKEGLKNLKGVSSLGTIKDIKNIARKKPSILFNKAEGETLEDFLKNSIGDYKGVNLESFDFERFFKPTYFDKSCTITQFSFLARRSPFEILALCRSKFPKTTLKDLFLCFKKLNIGWIICGDVHKIVCFYTIDPSLNLKTMEEESYFSTSEKIRSGIGLKRMFDIFNSLPLVVK